MQCFHATVNLIALKFCRLMDHHSPRGLARMTASVELERARHDAKHFITRQKGLVSPHFYLVCIVSYKFETRTFGIEHLTATRHEAGLAAYGNPLVGTRYVAPDDQKQNWTATYLKTTLQKRLAFLGERLAGKPFVAAGRFTAADISVAYIANGAKFAGIEDDIPPAVRAYIDALHQRPAYQRASAVA